MLDDVVRFIAGIIYEIVGTIIFEGLFNLITWRITEHPYLTCLYRGGLVALLVYIGMTIKHLFIDDNLSIKAFSDVVLSLKIWSGFTIILVLITFFIRYTHAKCRYNKS